MSEEDGFLAAIKASPEDDAPRLVYADWLDEHGRHEQAESIRLEGQYRRTLARLAELHETLDLEWANRVFLANGLRLRYVPREQTIGAIKLVREFLACGLAEAKYIVENLPGNLARPILFADLEYWEKLFREAGASVTMAYVPYRDRKLPG